MCRHLRRRSLSILLPLEDDGQPHPREISNVATHQRRRAHRFGLSEKPVYPVLRTLKCYAACASEKAGSVATTETNSHPSGTRSRPDSARDMLIVGIGEPENWPRCSTCSPIRAVPLTTCCGSKCPSERRAFAEDADFAQLRSRHHSRCSSLGSSGSRRNISPVAPSRSSVDSSPKSLFGDFWPGQVRQTRLHSRSDPTALRPAQTWCLPWP